ncbi:MAG: hypothetical protein Q9165_001845 [Trypethelium subeluteriae]
MDPITAIGTVASIVQLVDFGSGLLSKSRELYNSQTGLTQYCDDLVLTTGHLQSLADQVRKLDSDENDELGRLCRRCNEVSDDLLRALAGLKVEGKHKRWQSARKALKTVLGKDRIQDLERRLAGIRAELNFYSTFMLRQEVIRIRNHQSERFSDLDDVSQSIFQAVEESKDLFKATLDARVIALRTMHARLENNAQVRHDSTRDVLSDRIEDAIGATGILISEVETVNESIASNHNEHEDTRKEIAQLKAALEALTSQIGVRDTELKDLLTAFQREKDTRKRRRIWEQSKAVTAALYALQIVYERVQV